MVYPIILAVHNILRWVVLILGLIAVCRAWLGWLGKKDWKMTDRRIGVFFTSAMDAQMLFGLLLYFFFSDIVRGAFQDFSAAMSNPGLRFFALEHVFYMVLAIVFSHLGNILPKRVQDSLAKYKLAAAFLTMALLFILLGMPWSRPLLPGF